MSGNVFLNEDDFSAYLKKLYIHRERLVVLIAGTEAVTSDLLETEKDGLEMLGLTFFDNETNQQIFLAIIDKGVVVSEKIAPYRRLNKLEYQYNMFSVEARVQQSRIVVEGTDYCINRPGYEIVVYDKDLGMVVDSFHYGTRWKIGLHLLKCQQNMRFALEQMIAQGYSFYHYCRANGITSLRVVTNKVNEEVNRIFACSMAGSLPFVHVEYYCDAPQKIPLQCSPTGIDTIGYLSPQPLTQLPIDDDSTILFLTFESIYQITTRLGRDRGVLSFFEMERELSIYPLRERAIEAYAYMHPKVKILTYRIPRPPAAPTPYLAQLDLPENSEHRMIKAAQDGESLVEGQCEICGYKTEELSDIFLFPPRHFDASGTRPLDDLHTPFVNIENNVRRTLHQPSDYQRTVWLVGGCYVYGIFNSDTDTQATYLQDMLNSATDDIRVVNLGNLTTQIRYIEFRNLEDAHVCDGDIVIFEDNIKQSSQFFEVIDTFNIFNEDGVDPNVYVYKNHYNRHGNRLIAQALFNHLQKNDFYRDYDRGNDFAILADPGEPPLIFGIYPAVRTWASAQAETREKDPELIKYLADISVLKPRIGSIVMNCNPFTLGHRYLVEQSSKKVDRLYVFVVEEDKSIFPFADRLELVRQGTSDLPNVTVIPSGKYIISALTFSDYFNKSEIQDKVIDPSQDVELFGREIAPSLGINIRFAGEEPLDKVTQQYNDAMQRILPEYGVEFEVIPRKEQGGGVISASRVRKLLETKDFTHIADLVPKTTLDYLTTKWG